VKDKKSKRKLTEETCYCRVTTNILKQFVFSWTRHVINEFHPNSYTVC